MTGRVRRVGLVLVEALWDMVTFRALTMAVFEGYGWP